MGKKLLILALTAIMMLGVFGIAGCAGSQYDPYEDKKNPVVKSDDGYFHIQLYKKDGYALALELTDLGKEQEVLAIPDMVEDLAVTKVGLSKNWNSRIWKIESNTLKKIYIPYTVDYDKFTIPSGQNLKNVIFLAAENSISANLIYHYNYANAPNQNYYWFDIITGDDPLLNPIQPKREGYTFLSWFLESTCETEWDGVLSISENEKLSLYAGWN